MKAVVDIAVCIGCTLCTQMCPGVFRMEGDKAAVYVDLVPADMESDCRADMERCPVNAIKIEG